MSTVVLSVLVSWWSIHNIGIPFSSAWFANSGLSSALSRITIRSGFSSSTLLLYCAFRSGKDLIATPLPLSRERLKIRKEQSPSASLS